MQRLARANHSFSELVVLAPLDALKLLYVDEVLEYDSCEYGRCASGRRRNRSARGSVRRRGEWGSVRGGAM